MTVEKAKVMVQFRYHGDAPPDLKATAQRFGIKSADMDSDFGVIVTDPDAHLATILVAREIADIIEPQLKPPSSDTNAAEGIFGDVRIEPFSSSED